MKQADIELNTRFIASLQTPSVRHLAWLCHSPQLINDTLSFRPSEYLPHNLTGTLRDWDSDAANAPEVLSAPPHYRLGLYVEQLYECLLRDILGWNVIARNLPIRSAGITLGELDFVVQNPVTGNNEHHEIAIKFYLGYVAPKKTDRAPDNLNVRWYGPNARDRLDIKSQRMLQAQSQRCQLPETIETLSALDIRTPSISRIFMPGYLFYPVDRRLTAPSSADPEHARGQWLTLAQARQQTDLANWVVLRKPHWIAPWVQRGAPDKNELKSALEEIETTATPRLFALLSQDRESNLWQEAERFFVVPESWPER